MKKITYESCGCYIVYDNKLLVLKRSPDKQFEPSKWNVPGGGVEYKESSYHAVIREIQEEAGFTVDPSYAQSYVLDHYPTFVYHAYFIQLSKQPEIILNEESTEFKWVTLKEFLSLDLIRDEDTVLLDLVRQNKLHLSEE